MPVTLISRSGEWTKKPPSDVLVNSQHPLSRDLYGWGLTEGQTPYPMSLTTREPLQGALGTGWSLGHLGPVITMNGSAAYRTMNSLAKPIHGASALTIACCFKPASLSTGGTNDYILSFPLDAAGANGVDFRQNDGTMTFDLSTNSTDVAGPINVDITADRYQWAVLVFNGVDGSGMSFSFYLDGVLRHTDFISIFVNGTIDAASNEMNVGDFGSSFHAYWAGSVAFIWYWLRVLNAGEVLAIQTRPLDIFAPRPLLIGRSAGSSIPLTWLPRHTNIQGQKGAFNIPSGFVPPNRGH